MLREDVFQGVGAVMSPRRKALPVKAKHVKQRRKTDMPDLPTTTQVKYKIGQALLSGGRTIAGGVLAYWSVHDIIVTDRANPVPPPVGHYVLVGLFALLGTMIAIGKPAFDAVTVIIKGVKAWRSGNTAERRTKDGDEGAD